MKIFLENKFFGGVQGVYSYDSLVIGGEMIFVVYLLL